MSRLVDKTILLLTVTGLGAVSCSRTDSEIAPTSISLETWKKGDPIPANLSKFHQSDGCFRLSIFGDANNYPLLKETIFSPCDERVFDCAVSRSLSLVGPNQFFNDIREKFLQTPSLMSQQRYASLEARSHNPHVIVDGLFIDDKEMPNDEAGTVIHAVGEDLQSGLAFHEVLSKYSRSTTYTYTETLSDGTKVSLTRCRVGNYGDFVVSKYKHDAHPFRYSAIPAEHVGTLLACKSREVVVLRDEKEKRTILYQVREVYSPKQ
jgi:hypothetical protein